MSKPRNQIKRRLHYLGILIAAGLLTFGIAGPAMATEYGDGTTINAAEAPDGDGAVITGSSADPDDPGEVFWDIDGVAGVNDLIGGLHFNNEDDFSVTLYDSEGTTPDTEATITGGIDGAGNGSLYLEGYNLTITGGDITTTGQLDFHGDNSTLTATSSDVSGSVGFWNATSIIGTIGINDDAQVLIGGAVDVRGNIGATGTTVTIEVSAGGSISQTATDPATDPDADDPVLQGTVTITNNTDNAAANASFGSIATGGSVTATNATFAGMSGGTLIVDGSDVIDGDVTGTGNTITAANQNVDTITINGQIGELDATSDLTFSGQFQNVSLSSASLNINENSTLTLTSNNGAVVDYTTMTDNANVDAGTILLNAEGLNSSLTFGNVSGSAVVTAKATTGGAVKIGNVNATAATVNANADGQDSKSEMGDITSDDDATVTNTASNGGEAITGDVSGAASLNAGVTDGTGGSSTVGNINTTGTVTANAEGEGSSSEVGDVSDGTVTANATGVNSSSEVGDVSGGTVTAEALGEGSTSEVGDVSGGTVTATAEGEGSTSEVGDVSGGMVIANAEGKGSKSTVGDVSGGEVTANASAEGATVEVGKITETGQVTSEVSERAKAEYGTVSDGGTLNVTVNGADSAAIIQGDTSGNSINGGNLTAVIIDGGALTMGNIVSGSTATITASSSTSDTSSVSVGDVDKSTVTATTGEGGEINVHDINGSTVTADASSGGAINITNVIDSSLTAMGNVTVLGANQDVQIEVTDGSTVTLDGSYTGTANNVYSANDGGTVPEDYNVVLAGTAQIGSNDTTATPPEETVITFGESADPAIGSGVTVTSEADSQIRATNEPNGSTTVNFVNGTAADLSNTSINGGTVAINVDDSSSLTGIGDVNAIAGNAVNLTIDNQNTTTDTINAGNLNGLGDEYSSLTIANGNFTGGDISGNWDLANADGSTQTYTSIAADDKKDTNLNLGDGTTIANVAVTGNIGNNATSTTININSAGSSLEQTSGDTLGTVNINNNDGIAAINNLGDSKGIASTTLAVAGELAVNGMVYIAAVTGSAESNAAEGTVNLTNALDDNADLTIGDADPDKALVTVNAVDVTGGQVTVNDGGAFNQTGDITNTFIVTNNTNTDNQIALDNLTDGILNYGGTGNGIATLAQVLGESTIANTNTGAGSLNITAAAADSNTTYTGPGTTNLAATGDNAISIVQESGNLVLTGTLGAENVVTINDGSVTFGETFESGSAANITELTMDSSEGISTLTNNTNSILEFATDLDATIGDTNVVVNSGAGLTVADINLNTSGSGAFEVVGDALQSNAVNVNTASTINSSLILSTGTAANTITTATLNVNEALTVTGDFTVEDGASTEADPHLNFTAAAEYAAQGATAITVTGNASIAPDTVFTVDNTTPPADTYKFQVIGGNNVDASVWANLAYIDGNGFDDEGNSHFYDIKDGYYNYFSQAFVDNTVNGAPGFAKDYVQSAFDFNGLLASALGNSSNQELTMAMGNTLNAAFMTINNPLDSIFRNNNNLHERGANGVVRDTDCENFGLWITPNLNYRSINGNYGKGYGGFDIKSYGVTAGLGTCINKQFRLGIFAGLNDSELNGDFQKITSDDIQLGAYGQVILPADFRLNAGLAYIWHDFDAKRDVFVTGENGTRQRINSNFDGSTLIAALELNKTFYMEDNFFLRPGVGYTYMGTKLDSYTESSNAAKDWNLAQKVDSTDFDLHLFKVGTDIGWAAENASVVGRAYYVGNAGDNQPTTRAGFAHNPGGPLFDVVGAEYDDHMANLGLTLNVSPGASSHFALNYDALLGSDTTTHNVSLTFVYEW